MKSIILSTVTRFMMPVILLVSIFLLFRGHEAPGGGFIAALMAALAFCLYALAYGIEQVREALYVDPKALMGIGLLVALLSGTFAWIFEAPYMTGLWAKVELPYLGSVKIGTPLIFDIGVFLTVFGMATSVITGLGKE